MVFGYAAKARRQHVLHVKTRIGRQDDFLVVTTELLVTESAVVTRDAVLTAGHVGALMLRNRRSGVWSAIESQTTSARRSPISCERAKARPMSAPTTSKRRSGAPPRARPRSCRSTATATSSASGASPRLCASFAL